MPKAFVRQT